MGPGVAEGVFRAVVGKIGVFRVGEGKLQHPHPRHPGILQELGHVRGLETQVLRQELRPGEPGGENADQVHPGTGPPDAVPRGLLPIGDAPARGEGPEVVDADGVIAAGVAADAPDPPAEAVRAHPIPVVEGIAPELPVLREVVRRHAGDLHGIALLIQPEELPLAPDVGGVQGNVEGQVPDDLDAPLPGVGLQRRPLPVKEVLDIEVEVHILGEGLPPGCRRLRRVVPEGLVRPVQPAFPAEMLLGREIQGIVLHPGAAGAEGGDARLIPGPAPAEGAAQQRPPAGHHRAVVDGAAALHPGGIHLVLGEEAVRQQHRQVQQQGIPREGGDAGVGGVPAAPRRQGQHLPPALPGVPQEVQKFPGFRPQRTDAELRRQRKHRQQDPC